jgi:hypothetical protein
MFPIGSARRSIIRKGWRSLPPTSRKCGRPIMVVVPRLFEVLRQRISRMSRSRGKLTNT